MLIALFLGSVVAQAWVIPATASSMATRYPEVESLAVPYSTLAILGFLCLQVVSICLWRLLGRIDSGRFVESGSVRWVNAIIVAAAAGAGIGTVAFWHVLSVAQIGGPAAVFILGGSTAAALAVMIVAIVQRGRLKHTTTAPQVPAAA